MKARTLPQNKLLHALAAEVARHYPIVPWSRALAREAWKRYFIQLWVREMRMEAYANGQPDPFPVRPVPSRGLASWQMDALIECAIAFCALELDLILECPKLESRRGPDAVAYSPHSTKYIDQ